MKKLLILAVVSLICTANIVAQECNLCGTWIGSYMGRKHDEAKDAMVSDAKKLYIRINKYGEEYTIRMKETSTSDPSFIWYYDKTYRVLQSNAASIYFTYTGEMSRNYDFNDRIKSMDQSEVHYLLTYHNGKLHIKPTNAFLLKYDKNGNFMQKLDMSYAYYYPFNEMDLYKEENDW